MVRTLVAFAALTVFGAGALPSRVAAQNASPSLAPPGSQAPSPAFVTPAAPNPTPSGPIPPPGAALPPNFVPTPPGTTPPPPGSVPSGDDTFPTPAPTMMLPPSLDDDHDRDAAGDQSAEDARFQSNDSPEIDLKKIEESPDFLIYEEDAPQERSKRLTFCLWQDDAAEHENYEGKSEEDCNKYNYQNNPQGKDHRWAYSKKEGDCRPFPFYSCKDDLKNPALYDTDEDWSKKDWYWSAPWTYAWSNGKLKDKFKKDLEDKEVIFIIYNGHGPLRKTLLDLVVNVVNAAPKAKLVRVMARGCASLAHVTEPLAFAGLDEDPQKRLDAGTLKIIIIGNQLHASSAAANSDTDVFTDHFRTTQSPLTLKVVKGDSSSSDMTLKATHTEIADKYSCRHPIAFNVNGRGCFKLDFDAGIKALCRIATAAKKENCALDSTTYAPNSYWFLYEAQ